MKLYFLRGVAVKHEDVLGFAVAETPEAALKAYLAPSPTGFEGQTQEELLENLDEDGVNLVELPAQPTCGPGYYDWWNMPVTTIGGDPDWWKPKEEKEG
jgi:hypothetical protein